MIYKKKKWEDREEEGRWALKARKESGAASWELQVKINIYISDSVHVLWVHTLSTFCFSVFDILYPDISFENILSLKS